MMNDKITNPLFAVRMGYRGFTLVELMVVIGLVAILAAISTPTISRAMERSRINDLNRDLANSFLEARSFAMSSGEAVFARIFPGDNQVRFYLPDNFGDDANPAMSCATATPPSTAPAAGEAGSLFVIDVADYGVDQEIQGVGILSATDRVICFAPSGKVLNQNGAVVRSGCHDHNYYFWLGRVAPTDTCPDFTDQAARDLRAIDNIYFIHISYGGQVQVRQ